MILYLFNPGEINSSHNIEIALTSYFSFVSSFIFVVASGNHNQKQVNSDHPDYNNYEDGLSNKTLAGALVGDFYGRTDMTNRIGFPSDIGFDDSSGTDIYRTFNINFFINLADNLTFN